MDWCCWGRLRAVRQSMSLLQALEAHRPWVLAWAPVVPSTVSASGAILVSLSLLLLQTAKSLSNPIGPRWRCGTVHFRLVSLDVALVGTEGVVVVLERQAEHHRSALVGGFEPCSAGPALTLAFLVTTSPCLTLRRSTPSSYPFRSFYHGSSI